MPTPIGVYVCQGQVILLTLKKALNHCSYGWLVRNPTIPKELDIVTLFGDPFMSLRSVFPPISNALLGSGYYSSTYVVSIGALVFFGQDSSPKIMRVAIQSLSQDSKKCFVFYLTSLDTQTSLKFGPSYSVSAHKVMFFGFCIDPHIKFLIILLM